MRVRLKNLKSKTSKKTESDSDLTPVIPFSDCFTMPVSNARTLQIESTSNCGKTKGNVKNMGAEMASLYTSTSRTIPLSSSKYNVEDSTSSYPIPFSLSK